MRKLLLLGLLATTACSAFGPAYVRPGTTRQQTGRDFQACWDETSQVSTARVVASLFVTPLAITTAAHDRPARERCMQARGYQIGPGRGWR